MWPCAGRGPHRAEISRHWTVNLGTNLSLNAPFIYQGFAQVAAPGSVELLLGSVADLGWVDADSPEPRRSGAMTACVFASEQIPPHPLEASTLGEKARTGKFRAFH